MPRLVPWLVASLLALGCAAEGGGAPVRTTRPRAPPAPQPPVACTWDTSAPAIGVLSREILARSTDAVRPVVEDAVCACAARYGLAAPSTLSVGAVHTPIEGRVDAVTLDLVEGDFASLDWAGLEACATERARGASLDPWPLGACTEPGSSGGRIVLVARMSAR